MKFGIFYELQWPRPGAERIAVPDLLSSSGGCEFGMGESASVTELTPFSRDMDT